MLLLLPVTHVQATVLSGPMTNPANGHVYYLLDTASWTDSEAEALTLGGHLVTINNAAENDWVFDTFVPLLPTDVFATLWIGLNDAAQEGTFVWVSGEPVTFTNWSTNQPDNARGTEDYAHVWTQFNLPQAPAEWRKWNDAANDGFGVGTPYGVVEVANAPDADGDGIPDTEDECPDSDLSATVVIDSCNSGVTNTLFASGCTISDLIAECAEGASNHGQFVSCVSHVTNDLKKAGTITGQQKGAIQSCAAQADIP
jgi:lectin-like protein